MDALTLWVSGRYIFCHHGNGNWPFQSPNSTPNFCRPMIQLQNLSAVSLSISFRSLTINLGRFFWGNPRKNWSPEFKNHKRISSILCTLLCVYIYISTHDGSWHPLFNKNSPCFFCCKCSSPPLRSHWPPGWGRHKNHWPVTIFRCPLIMAGQPTPHPGGLMIRAYENHRFPY